MTRDRSKGYAIFSALAVAFVACSRVENSAVEVSGVKRAHIAPIRTDRTRYVLQKGAFGPETTIATTFTAPKDQTVYLVNCNGAFSAGLQRLVGNAWVDAWGVLINGCLSEPITIPAGGQHSGPMFIARGAGAVLYPRRDQDVIESGTYRVVWYGVLTSFDADARPFGKELPLEQRVSAPFLIEVPAVVASP